MLFHITELSLLFASFIALTFHSLERCLERDVETGSCVRVGDKGSLFKTCVTAFVLIILFFRFLLHVSVCLAVAGLLNWLFYAERVLTHSCVNFHPVTPKRHKMSTLRS